MFGAKAQIAALEKGLDFDLVMVARARARRLEHQSDEVYFPRIIRLMGLQDNLRDAVAISSIESATAYYSEMEKLLTTRHWLAGNYSFADISLYMASLFGDRQSAPVTPATPKLLEWRDRMTQRPAVRTVVGAMANWLRAAGRPVPAFMNLSGSM